MTATYLVYLDEQEGMINGEKFTAIIGFRININDINEIKKSFYKNFNAIVNRESSDESDSGIQRANILPHLHGADFLRNYNDTVKSEVLDALSSSLEGCDFHFLRVGYFDRSFPPETEFSTRNFRLNHALLGISFAIRDKPDDYHILVSEIDAEALKKNLESNFNNPSLYFVIGADNVSYNLMKTAGHFYAPKSDLGCQVADVFNYCCLKSSSDQSAYGKMMASYYFRFSNRYLVNQIIWVNNSELNYNLEQSNPISDSRNIYATSPLQYAVTIIPNDERLETVEILSVPKT